MAIATTGDAAWRIPFSPTPRTMPDRVAPVTPAPTPPAPTPPAPTPAPTPPAPTPSAWQIVPPVTRALQTVAAVAQGLSSAGADAAPVLNAARNLATALQTVLTPQLTAPRLAAQAVAQAVARPQPPPASPTREPEGAWAKVVPWRAETRPASAANFMGPVLPASFAQRAAASAPVVASASPNRPPSPTPSAVMPPETPATVEQSSRSGRTYSTSGRSYRSSGGSTYYRSSSGGGSSATAAGDFSSLSPAYVAAFATAFRVPINEYYTAERGSAAQALRDYQNIMSLWQARTGRPITPEEIVRLLNGFAASFNTAERNPTWEDFVSYVFQMSERQVAPQLPAVSYLNMGAI